MILMVFPKGTSEKGMFVLINVVEIIESKKLLRLGEDLVLCAYLLKTKTRGQVNLSVKKFSLIVMSLES